MRSYFRGLICLLLLCVPALAEERPSQKPLEMVNCYLRQQNEVNRQAPSSEWDGMWTVRNNTDKEMVVKSGVLQIYDGYGKYLFNIKPDVSNIAAHREAQWRVHMFYPGSVTVFQFGGEVTIVGLDKKDMLVKFPPRATQPSSSDKFPGY